MYRLAENESGGVLTVGVLGAIWSSSSALVSIVDALNHVYEIEEARSWWRVRLIATGLTLAVALLVLLALAFVLGGSLLADLMGRVTGWGAPFSWAWLVLQWPLVFALMTTALGLIYHFGPDADQDWSWLTPGTVVATVLWVLISLLFKAYIAQFTDYEGSYGTVGGVMVVLLWFYTSGLAILIGAEVNAEIEHAQPHAKVTRLTNVHGKVLLGDKAARALERKRRKAR
jgi:membrane protein